MTTQNHTRTIAEMTTLELLADLKPSNISDYRRELLKRAADLDQFTACAISVLAGSMLERRMVIGSDYRACLKRIYDLVQPCLNRNMGSSGKSECVSRCTIGVQEASEGSGEALGSSDGVGGDSGASGEVDMSEAQGVCYECGREKLVTEFGFYGAKDEWRPFCLDPDCYVRWSVKRLNGAEYERSTEEPIRDWFGLSYASYMVAPRVLMQEMPLRWQREMVKLFEEFGEMWDYPDNYVVQLRGEDGKFAYDPLREYRRPDPKAIEEVRRER